MLKIRLMRIGAKKRPFYRVVVVDERAKRTGGYIELLGTYNPLTEPKDIKLKQDRIDHWVKMGAQMSDGYLRIIGKAKQRPARKPKKEKKVEVTPQATPQTPTEQATQPETPTQEQAEEPQIEAPAEQPEAAPAEEKKEEIASPPSADRNDGVRKGEKTDEGSA